MSWLLFGTLARRLRAKWTWERCHLLPWQWMITFLRRLWDGPKRENSLESSTSLRDYHARRRNKPLGLAVPAGPTWPRQVGAMARRLMGRSFRRGRSWRERWAEAAGAGHPSG